MVGCLRRQATAFLRSAGFGPFTYILDRNIFTQVAGVPVLCSAGPAHQVALELEGGEPGGFCMELPGFMLHRWHGGQFLSHAVVVADCAGP